MKHYNSDYTVHLESINVVGEKALVMTGQIDVELCGRTYDSLDVSYADIPHVALIGMDLVSKGKLDVDSGLRISFTYH